MLCIEPLGQHPDVQIDVADMLLIGRYFDRNTKHAKVSS